MTLVEQLLPFEREIFLWLNDHHTPFWDTFMFAYSTKFTWIPLCLTTLYVFVRKIERREALLAVFCMVLLGILCDQLSASIIKPFFERLRPSHHPDFKDLVNVVYNYRGGLFGFVSSHVTNGFGIVVFTSLVFRYRWYTLLSVGWVLVTAYSRVYLGVHFVTDIIGGMLLGSVLGLFVYGIYLALRYYFLKIPKNNLAEPALSLSRVHLLMGCVAATVFCIVSVSIASVVY